jgi:tellurite resistance protein TerC
MFFMLAGVIGKFWLLKPSLALVLGFVGVKMLLLDVYKIPIQVSLAVVASMIAFAIVGSLLFPRKDDKEGGGTPLPAVR